MLEKVNKRNDLVNFNEKDFIELRLVSGNSDVSFYLVIHIKSFHVFMMKKIIFDKNSNNKSHEIEFDKEYSHRCLTPFYGFVRKEEIIVGFIYEFMSNGTLVDFINKNENENENKEEEIFCYMTMIRIAEAIKYLHSNSLIHRDIKPLNILVDHNNIPYLSDFDTIRKIDNSTSEIASDIGSIIYTSPEQYSDVVYSFPADIYSFGQIIYFIFEKNDNLKGNDYSSLIEQLKTFEIKEESKIPKSLQNIFKRCISFHANDRPSINQFFDFLYEETSSFEILKISFLKKIIHNMNKPQIQQYFKEIYHLLFIERDFDEKYFHKHEIELFQILNFINKSEISSILHSVGKLYYDGEIIQQDFQKAKEYFEISSEMNNLDAFFNLGILYTYGRGVPQDYEKAIKYYEIAAKHNHYTAINDLGALYLFGFGVEKNYQKAKEYFELAAEHNNGFALCNMGLIYMQGFGVEQDFKKAKEYLELAAKRKIPTALSK